MRSRPTTDHQDAVARRLALLSAELAGSRPDPGSAAPVDPEADPGLDEPTYAMEPTHTRVRAPRWEAVEEAVSGEATVEPVADLQPPPVPRPGRHAARRLGRSVSGVVPETMRGRVALGPSQLALVAVLVAVGLALTAWWVVRGDPRQVAAPVSTRPVQGLATPAAGSVPAPSARVAGDAGTAAGGQVTVDVAGKVRRPGIVVLDAGSRVVDAIEAAGGARPRVDLTGLNLARVLVDGEQVLVGSPAPTVAGSAVAGAPPATPGALVNLNAATAAELESLPEVGPVTAAAILAWREENGGFTAVEELLEVDGIGDATLATIAPHVTV